MIDIDKEAQAFEQWFSAGDHNGCGIEIWLAAKRHAAQVAETSDASDIVMTISEQNQGLASVDSVARDAARYRWWRVFLEPGDMDLPECVAGAKTAAELDAAIDAEIAAMSPTKAGEIK